MTGQSPSTITDPYDGPVISLIPSRPFWDLLIATVNLAVARSMLRELIRLADESPGLTDEQLRFRLLALAACATTRSHVPSRSPAGRWLSETPDSAPSGQPAPHNTTASAP